MKYCVIVARSGAAFVEAKSAEEAMSIVDRLPGVEISWSDDWEVTDVSEDDSIVSCINDD